MQAVLVQHVGFEGPGLVLEALSTHGVDVRVVRTDRLEALPAPEDLDVLVVMGGPMGAFDDAEHPHLSQERSLIARCMRQGRPVLGVCLGAQLLAASLGADVRRGAVLEVGAGSVQLTGAGLADPVLGPSGPSLPVVHWHQDTFSVPAGAELLASSSHYAHQAFRIGTSYGFQFHTELGEEALRELAPHLPPGVVMEPSVVRAAAEAGRQLLHRWARRAVDGADRRRAGAGPPLPVRGPCFTDAGP